MPRNWRVRYCRPYLTAHLKLPVQDSKTSVREHAAESHNETVFCSLPSLLSSQPVFVIILSWGRWAAASTKSAFYLPKAHMRQAVLDLDHMSSSIFPSPSCSM